MSYKYEVINHPAQRVLSIRTHAAMKDLPVVLPQSFDAIAQYICDLGQQPAGAPVVAYYSSDPDMQNLEIEIGYPVAQTLPGQGNIQLSEMSGGKAAACLYVGPYDKIQAAYEALMHWMQTQGHEGTGVCYEVYLNDPEQTPPEALETQIVFLIK
jgi:effector-binding domain-containing protein